MDRKTLITGKINGCYGQDEVRVEQMTRGRHAGRFVCRGGGFAGRAAYSTIERAKASVEAHAHFAGWAA